MKTLLILILALFSFNGYCQQQDTLKIIIPSAITPNNDGVNDTLLIGGLINIQDYQISILNRWGHLVYKYGKGEKAFGGIDQNGATVPDGVYYLIIDYWQNQEKYSRNSVLTVIRK
jgi:gliding motility-associated-like protein